MQIYDTVDLIAQTFTVNNIGDSVATETRRTVYCVVDSVGAKRKVEAMSAGNKAEIKLILSDTAEYQNEQIIEYNGHRYNVVSYAVKDDQRVELTARKY